MISRPYLSNTWKRALSESAAAERVGASYEELIDAYNQASTGDGNGP